MITERLSQLNEAWRVRRASYKPNRRGAGDPRNRVAFAVEQMESRELLATLGVPWADARHLTLSLAPDGTPIAGHQSALFETLDATMPRAVWQREILRAFQSWAVPANINVSLEADTGAPFGEPGRTQGDPRFGDIRVGAQKMSADAISVSVPHDPFFSGTWAGDVLLNSLYRFDGTRADLFSTMLHEAGHVFGLGHSDDPQSAMFSHANQVRTGLTQGDIAAIRDLYGSRGPDLNELSRPNDSIATATRIKYSQNSDGYDGSTPLVTYGDITTSRDVDYFWLRPISGYRGAVTFRAQTTGVSLLAPKLTVLDSAGRVLGQSQGSELGGSVVTVQLPRVNPNATYYARIEGATRDVFGIGGFALATTFDAALTTPESAIDALLRGPYEGLRQETIDEILRDPASVFFNDDLHADDTPATAIGLKSPPGYAADSHFETTASLSDAADVDVYRIKSPSAPRTQTTVLTASVRAADINGTVPHVSVLDGNLMPVSADVLVNGNGTFTVQVAGARARSNYYVVVQPNPTWPAATGNYALNVEFTKQAAQLTTFASGVLTGPSYERVGNLYVAETQLLHLLLSAHSPLGSTAAVQMTITDASGSTILSLTSPGGDPVSALGVLLAPGAYSIRFTGLLSSPVPGDPLVAPLTFLLGGIDLDEPIGPTVDDPTLTPAYTCPGMPATFCYPGGTVTPAPFYWDFTLA